MTNSTNHEPLFFAPVQITRNFGAKIGSVDSEKPPYLLVLQGLTSLGSPLAVRNSASKNLCGTAKLRSSKFGFSEGRSNHRIPKSPLHPKEVRREHFTKEAVKDKRRFLARGTAKNQGSLLLAEDKGVEPSTPCGAPDFE